MRICSGYLKKTNHCGTWHYLPDPISIEEDPEFAFSNWISYAYLGYTRIVNPLTQGGLP
jgi:hypothetical protein